MFVNVCVSRLRIAGHVAEREVLFAYYILRLSLRDVADLPETNRMQMRNLLVAGENFVNSGLMALGVRLDIDLVLKATRQMKAPALLLPGFEDVSVRAPVTG